MIKKIKALLMALLIICFSFTLYIPEVKAANVDTCGMTNDGDYCVEASIGTGFSSYGGCASGHLFTGKSAEEVDECNLGTCVPQTGRCLSNKYQVECIMEESGAWSANALTSIPDCQIGCCSYSNSLCSLEEKKYCTHDLAFDNQNAFLGTSFTYDTCNNECRGAELGCYKFPNAGCDYGTREQFSSQAGYVSSNFYSGIFCSDVIGCFTTEKTYVMCGDGTTDDDKLDVYYFDSGMNREELKNDCGYPDNICYDPDGEKGADAYCKSTNCVSGLNEYADPGDFRSGESLCINVAPYHYTNEGRSTAIKPYILSCQYGNIVADDSIADRSVVCIEETDASGRLHADTITNKWHDCHGCGSGGGLLGNLGDVFGFLVPPLSSAALALTTQPCKEERDTFVWYGDQCQERGKVNGIKMCGYGPLSNDNYDNDLWEPIGSCNPIYPPSGNHCGKCGRGGDNILNTCTVDECNALGDCKFVKQNFNWDVGVTAGGVWVGTCTTMFLAAQLVKWIPGASEALTGAAAGMCTLSAQTMTTSIIIFLATLGLGVGASLSTQETTGEGAEFELTDDGKVRLKDILIVGKSLDSASDLDLSDMGVIAGSNAASSYYYWIGEAIFKNGGYLTQDALLRLFANIAAEKAYKETFDLLSKSIDKVITKETFDLLKKMGVDISFIKVGETELTGNMIDNAATNAKEKARESVKSATGTIIILKVINSILVLFQVYSLGKSFNPGKCDPETAYTNNQKCELCGPGEGQWFCTQKRCNILGGTNGHCKWFAKDTGEEDGTCLPLDVTDANPPVINKINITFYDPNHLLKGFYTSNDNSLEITPLINWNTTEADIYLETNEPAECGYSKIAQAVYSDGTTGFDYNSTILETEHKVTVSFDESDKSNPNGIYIYFKCMDINENKIEDDNNYINFKFEGRPDTEPPLIKYINPQNVFLPEGTTSVNLEVHAYDENRVSSCKYSPTSTNYPDMTAFTPGGQVDCSDMVSPNNACDKFTTPVNVASGGTIIDFGNLIDGNQNLQGLENMRSFFYSIKCSDGGNNIMREALNWSLTVVPTYDMDINGPSGDVYDLTPTFNVSTTNPANCYYKLGSSPTEYYFNDLFAYDHYKEHNQTLTPGSYTFSVHCEDWAGNVKDSTGSFNVKVVPLDLLSAEPNGTIIYFNYALFEVVTDGGWYGNGNSTCKYKETDNYGTKIYSEMTPFTDKEVLTTQTTHTVNVTFSQGGDKQYYILCRDEIGSQGDVYIQNQTFLEFTVDFNSPPIIIGIYTTSSTLNIMLNENGICRYDNIDPNFDFEAGEGNSMIPATSSTSKSAALGNSVYYIKCEDSYGNNNNNNPYIVYP